MFHFDSRGRLISYEQANDDAARTMACLCRVRPSAPTNRSASTPAWGFAVVFGGERWPSLPAADAGSRRISSAAGEFTWLGEVQDVSCYERGLHC